MIGAAAGLSTYGFTPFVHAFAMFMAGRGYDQIRNSICYPNLNVKCVGTHGGLSVGEDGATHQCVEDIALMRAIPNMTVICPADANETRAAVHAIAAHEGPVYLRLGRVPVETVTDFPGYQFTIGKSVTLREGTDLTIIATGMVVADALAAAEELEKEGVIESVPGRGFYVCEQKNDHLREKQMMNIEKRMSDILEECVNAGMTLEDVIDMVRVLGEK